MSGCEETQRTPEALCRDMDGCLRDHQVTEMDRKTCVEQFTSYYKSYPKCANKIDDYLNCVVDLVCGYSNSCGIKQNKVNDCLGQYYSSYLGDY